jgi:hypothetical protein
VLHPEDFQQAFPKVQNTIIYDEPARGKGSDTVIRGKVDRRQVPFGLQREAKISGSTCNPDQAILNGDPD